MGQFSWICSDTDNSLVCYDTDEFGCINFTKKAFLLIPKEFGGGSFKVDHDYDGYGDFYDDCGNEHDAYEELAKWNGVAVEGDKQKSRSNAIELYFKKKDGDYNTEETMKYPLKIVEFECAYEDAEPCCDDPNQGWGNYIYEEDEDDYEEDYYDDDDDFYEEDE